MNETVPTKLDRVRANTSAHINRRIDAEIERNVYRYSEESPATIQARITELQSEWDIERLIELNAALLAFIGTLLGLLINNWFFAVPLIVTAFLCQHAVQGWCPPVPIFRRMGKRTRDEIDAEKFAMKALRGDFEKLQGRRDDPAFVRKVLDAIRTQP